MQELEKDIIDEMRGGSIIIYPTDTIYGIGCNALLDGKVKKIYAIKKRPESMPLSVIAPSFEWIKANCEADMRVVKKYLPGPYTLILKKKDPCFLKSASSGKDTIGVRIINHPIMGYFRKADVPFITTSVNVSGKEPICDISKIPKDIGALVDIAIYCGIICGKPSKVVDLSGTEKTVIRQ